jgi:hypothetical protein
MAYLQSTGESVLFRPYFYLCILGVLAVFGIWQKRWDVIMIAASGGLYCVTYGVIIYQSTFRFACFTVFITLVILARLIAECVAAKMDPEYIS